MALVGVFLFVWVGLGEGKENGVAIGGGLDIGNKLKCLKRFCGYWAFGGHGVLTVGWGAEQGNG